MKKYKLDYYFHMLFNKPFNIILLVSSISFIYACSSVLYVPSQGNVTINTTLEELQKGRQLYINKCSGCHSLILPDKYNSEEWKIRIEKMKLKAKTSDEENDLILKYLTHKLIEK